MRHVAVLAATRIRDDHRPRPASGAMQRIYSGSNIRATPPWRANEIPPGSPLHDHEMTGHLNRDSRQSRSEPSPWASGAEIASSRTRSRISTSPEGNPVQGRMVPRRIGAMRSSSSSSARSIGRRVHQFSSGRWSPRRPLWRSEDVATLWVDPKFIDISDDSGANDSGVPLPCSSGCRRSRARGQP